MAIDSAALLRWSQAKGSAFSSEEDVTCQIRNFVASYEDVLDFRGNCEQRCSFIIGLAFKPTSEFVVTP
jgi:hypothetical protein